MGLTREGHKVILDFESGASEKTAVAKLLVAHCKRPVSRRGDRPALPGCARWLGAAAKRGAHRLANTIIQRCLVHKERNLHGYLRRGDDAESSRLWRRLRLAEGRSRRPRSAA